MICKRYFYATYYPEILFLIPFLVNLYRVRKHSTNFLTHLNKNNCIERDLFNVNIVLNFSNRYTSKTKTDCSKFWVHLSRKYFLSLQGHRKTSTIVACIFLLCAKAFIFVTISTSLITVNL